MVGRGLAVIALVALGFFGIREWRTTKRLEPITSGLAFRESFRPEQLDELVRRVARHSGPREAPKAEWWFLRVPADSLDLSQTSCGDATIAAGAALARLEVPFRVQQLNLGPSGPRHVILEAFIDGRWVLADPIVGRLFRDPTTGQALSLEGARARGRRDDSWLEPRYRHGAPWSLFGASRTTNWKRWFGDAAPVARAVLGEETSVRALIIVADRWACPLALAVFVSLFAWRHARSWRHKLAAQPRSSLAPAPAAQGSAAAQTAATFGR